VDLVFVPFFSNIRYAWEQLLYGGFLERLASFSRLIMFDKRGMGLSDRPRAPTLETQVDDIRNAAIAYAVFTDALPARACQPVRERRHDESSSRGTPLGVEWRRSMRRKASASTTSPRGPWRSTSWARRVGRQSA
jgi:hypothetical protein